MNSSRPHARTLRDDLDLLELSAPSFEEAPHLHSLPSQPSPPNWKRPALMATGIAAAAAVVIVGVITASRVETPDDRVAPAAPGPTHSAPATVPASTSTDYAAGCGSEQKARGVCPIDDRGARLWDELVVAFDGYLTPTRLVQVPLDQVGPDAPSHNQFYLFEAVIGSPDEPDHRYRLRVAIAQPNQPQDVAPSLTPHPAFPPDFRFGQGAVDITQSNGTGMTLRFWDTAEMGSEASRGALDVPNLFRSATEELAS